MSGSFEDAEFVVEAELSAEPQNTAEGDRPDLDWFSSPTMGRADMLAVIERCKDLDGRAINLFRNVLNRQPHSDLLRNYVGPNLYRPDSHYIYTTPDPA